MITDIEILPAKGGQKYLPVRAVFKGGAALDTGRISKQGSRIIYTDDRFGGLDLGTLQSVMTVKRLIKDFLKQHLYKA